MSANFRKEFYKSVAFKRFCKSIGVESYVIIRYKKFYFCGFSWDWGRVRKNIETRINSEKSPLETNVEFCLDFFKNLIKTGTGTLEEKIKTIDSIVGGKSEPTIYRDDFLNLSSDKISEFVFSREKCYNEIVEKHDFSEEKCYDIGGEVSSWTYINETLKLKSNKEKELLSELEDKLMTKKRITFFELYMAPISSNVNKFKFLFVDLDCPENTVEIPKTHADYVLKITSDSKSKLETAARLFATLRNYKMEFYKNLEVRNNLEYNFSTGRYCKKAPSCIINTRLKEILKL